MDFSRFFIDRPIFAAVLSIVIFAAGLITIPILPISEYPEVVPPSVVVRTVYPGANPKVIAETVATPLEEAINGVEGMMYLKSVAGSDGVLQMTVTFRPGTDPDAAAVKVQNRVAQAQARLPEDVRRQGVTTQKQSPTFLMVVHLTSPQGKYDTLYLRNYARLHVKDALARIPGVGDAQIFGGGDYAMRAWLDPDKVASRGLTASDVVRAMREQNVQVSAGQLGAEPLPNSQFLTLINAQGRLKTEKEFGDIVLKSGTDGEIVRLADVARLELGAGDYTLRSQLDGKNAVGIGIFQSPGANALEIRDQVISTMDEMQKTMPADVKYEAVYDTTIFVRDSIKAVVSTLLEAIALVVLVVILFLQTWRASIIPLIAVPVSVVGTFAALYLLGFSINTLSLFGLVLAIGIVVDDAILLVGTGVIFKLVPPGFIPTQDKLYLIAGVKLPEGSSIARTDEMLRKVAKIAQETDGVAHTISFPGLNALQFTNTPNTGVAFIPLKPFAERHGRTAAQINAEINQKIAGLQEGFAFAMMPPPILGLGNGNGYQMFIEDRGNLGYGALQNAVQAMQGTVAQTPGMAFPISSYQANVPQLDAEVDRVKAKAQGVQLTELFDTLQTYLGSAYVNDFNQFGRTWQVIAQADGPFRETVEDIGKLRTRNDRGEMVPIGSMVTIKQTFGPDPVLRFNGYPAADLAGEADPRLLSSAEAMNKLTEIAGKVLPVGMTTEWTDLSYQQATQGKAAFIVFPVAIMLAFLVLAALYESWSLPLAVILIVPMTLLSALFGVWLTGGDNNVFVQVGLVVLMGLACKNAILIVEFARELEMGGKGIVEAALEACRLRLRPIVMTSIAFIAGTVPLVLSHGAGAEVRSVTGITVFAGMLGVTLFGLFLTPVFYVALRKFVTRNGGGQLVQHGEPTIHH